MTNEDWFQLIRDTYMLGFSTRQVAKQLKISPSWVHKICQKSGITRGRSEAATLRQPAISKHQRSARAAARKIWVRAYGRPVPKGMDVHHIDFDYTNNTLTNLQLVTRAEHMRLHRPKNPVPRHLRPERKEYMRKYYLKMQEKRPCVNCGRLFKCLKYSLQLTCSHSCATTLQWSFRRNVGER